MASKKQYYGLDETGFIGTQSKKSKARAKKDVEKTIQHMKARKSGKLIALSAKKNLSKAK